MRKFVGKCVNILVVYFQMNESCRSIINAICCFSGSCDSDEIVRVSPLWPIRGLPPQTEGSDAQVALDQSHRVWAQEQTTKCHRESPRIAKGL